MYCHFRVLYTQRHHTVYIWNCSETNHSNIKHHFGRRGFGGKLLELLLQTFGFFASTMFGVVVISMLAAKKDNLIMESLEQLAKSNLKIYVPLGQKIVLQELPGFDGIESRVVEVAPGHDYDALATAWKEIYAGRGAMITVLETIQHLESKLSDHLRLSKINSRIVIESHNPTFFQMSVSLATSKGIKS
jgi:hypothetical protein